MEKPPAFKPPFVYGREFDKLKVLKNEYEMDNWEIVS